MRCLAVSLLSAAVVLAACSTSGDGEGSSGDPGGTMTVPIGTKCATDGECGGGRCVDGACAPRTGCQGPADCDSHVCGSDGTCQSPTSSDGVKNGSETDIDCGGGAPTNAPLCAAGKACLAATDCFWGHCDGNVCGDHVPGTKDGDESDVDCGGTQSPGCDWFKACNADDDCASKVCGLEKQCLPGPSCVTVHGGTTCGTGEFPDATKNHESCCRTLPVAGYADPRAPGKTVYVDKYEITAGRMRKFLETLGGGVDAKGNALPPDVKGWITAHTPARWNAGWTNVLPSGNSGSSASYTVKNPTVDLNYPGNDVYQASSPKISGWSVSSGSYDVDVGVFFSLGAVAFFPEFSPLYAETHNLNCTNTTNGYGYGTYWFDKDTIHTYSYDSSVGKFFTQDQLDEKALNCTTYAMFAAFCAWDGGQIMTTEAFDFIAGGTWNGTTGTPPPRLAGGNTPCGPGGNTLNTFSDGTGNCANVYFYPNDMGNTYDASSKIAPPGRVPADTVRIAAGDEPWMDLKGNLIEAVMRPDTTRFDMRGFGVSYYSVQFHKVQASTGRMKAGAFGARCMRFK
jgi:hypothetical protein